MVSLVQPIFCVFHVSVQKFSRRWISLENVLSRHSSSNTSAISRTRKSWCMYSHGFSTWKVLRRWICSGLFPAHTPEARRDQCENEKLNLRARRSCRSPRSTVAAVVKANSNPAACMGTVRSFAWTLIQLDWWERKHIISTCNFGLCPKDTAENHNEPCNGGASLRSTRLHEETLVLVWIYTCVALQLRGFWDADPFYRLVWSSFNPGLFVFPWCANFSPWSCAGLPGS